MGYESGELCHYGIPGMKWGVRRASNDHTAKRARAKQEYKDAKRNLKTVKRTTKGGVIGIEGIAKANAKERKVNAASVETISKKAAYNASKAKNPKRAEKAEFKTYRNEMHKTGLAGSAKDREYGGRSTAIYNKVKAEKGKAYADKIQKSVQNRAYADIAASAAVGIGALAVDAYLRKR